MLTPALQMAGIGAAALALMMLLIWLISVRINNAGLVDVGWALGLVVLAVWYASRGSGFPARKWMLAGMVVPYGDCGWRVTWFGALPANQRMDGTSNCGATGKAAT